MSITQPFADLALAAFLSVSPVNQRSFALPALPAPQPNATVWLRWNRGIPAQTTIRNLTTGRDYDAGVSDNFEVRGLVRGSTNVFVAFNAAGFSNQATGLATIPSRMASISIHTFLVELPVIPNESVAILTSTNLLTWRQIGMIITSNSVYRFLWTNDSKPHFFRSALP